MNEHQAKIKRFAELIDQQSLEHFRRKFPKPEMSDVEFVQLFQLNASIRPGRKYTKVDVGTSGRYMVDGEGNIFGIKGYGNIHRGHRYGTLDTVDDWFWGNYQGMKVKA